MSNYLSSKTDPGQPMVYQIKVEGIWSINGQIDLMVNHVKPVQARAPDVNGKLGKQLICK